MHDFLNKLLPFSSLYPFNEGSLTAYWITATIILFLFVLLKYFQRISSLRKIFINQIKDFDIELFEKNEILKNQWYQYRQTFLYNEKEKLKTIEEAEYYFGPNIILNQIPYIRLYESLPGILVGIGILGTFVGLTLGISSFNTNSTETIKNSIQLLLTGMGTAFVTSIWGMGLSILYIFLEKIFNNSLSNKTNQLCLLIDSKFKLTKADEIKYKKEEQEYLFEKYFNFKNENNKSVYPSDVFRRIVYDLEQQTKALKSFSTDLADGIKISTETIISLGDKVGNVFKATINEELKPTLDNLNNSIKVLQELKEESSAEVIERIINNVDQTLKNVIENFHNSLSGNTMSQLENLAGIVNKAGESLIALPNLMENIVNDFKLTIGLQQESLKDTSSRVSEEAAAAIEIMKDEVENAAKSLKNTIDSLQDNMAGLLNNQQTNVNSIDVLVEKTKNVFENGELLANKLNNSIDIISSTYKNINYLSSSLIESKNTLDKSSLLLNQNSNIFKTEIETFIKTNRELLNQHLLSIQKAKDTAGEFSQKFEIINKDLKSIFGQIQSGLNDYQKAVKDSINIYLGEFTDSLSSATDNLKRSIELLSEGVEDLTDLFEKRNRN